MSLDTVEVERIFGDAVRTYGVRQAWDGMAMPVLQSIGERWRVTGDCVDVEHAFSEAVLGVLRGVTSRLRRPRNVRPVVLACAEGDYHTLPVHALAAALAEESVGTRILGVGLPPAALVAAVRRSGPAAVFLYARLPAVDAEMLDLLPRQRPAPRVVLGGPGWAAHALPPTVAVTTSLDAAVEAVLEAVDRLLDALQARGHRSQPPREAVDVGRRGEIERAHRGLLRVDGLLARGEGARDRGVDQRVLEQVRGQLAERLLPLPREPVPQAGALFLCHRRATPYRT
jgi:hypothetical protein